MQLQSLTLRNYRQHRYSKVEFSPGLTVVVGLNGAGKSSILEAVAWAIYGAEAVKDRSKVEGLLYQYAGSGDKVEVELVFELAGHQYRIERRLREANLYLDGSRVAAVMGVKDVTKYLTEKLGMDYQAFFTSYFTGQKELAFLAELRPEKKAEMISRMLGLEQLTEARARVREDKNLLHRELQTREHLLPDPSALKLRRDQAQERWQVSGAALEKAKEAVAAAQGRLEQLAPLVQQQTKDQEQHDHLRRDLEALDRELARLLEESKRLGARRDELARGEAELAQLAPLLAEYEAVHPLVAALDEAAEQARVRSELVVRLKYLEQEQRRGSQQLAMLEQAMSALAQEQKLVELDVALEKLAQQEGERRREQLAAQHELEALRKQQNLLQRRYKAIADTGEAGTCPTCGRDLGREFPTVLAHLGAELQQLAAQQETCAKRLPGLGAALQELERERARLTLQRRSASDQVQQLQRQQLQRDQLQADLKRWGEELDALRAELGPEVVYDAAKHRDLKARELRLRAARERAIALRASTDQLPQLEIELAERSQRRTEAQRRREALGQALQRLGFDPQRYARLTQELQAATNELHTAQVAQERRRGERRLAESELAQVEAEGRRLAEGLRELAEGRRELMALEVLDTAYTDLRTGLSSRIRPELSRMASRHLAMLTEGLYTALELDEEYNVHIVQDGEWLPLSRFSGGENDVANLSLRLAISEMIADRSGTQLSLLILDEIFGSLDDTRQHNVVQMLRGLSNRFEQIILITHVDVVRHGADTVLRVEYNEQKRESVVRCEAFGDGLSPVQDEGVLFRQQ